MHTVALQDICEPEPIVVEISSSSETYNVEESSTEYVEGGNEDLELGPKESKASLDLDIFIKEELDTIIDSFDKGHPDLENVEATTNDVEAEERVSVILDPDLRATHILKGTENDTTEDTKPPEVNEQNDFQDANDDLGSAMNESENAESNADQGTEVNETINLESNEVDDDDLNKKVKFYEKGLGNIVSILDSFDHTFYLGYLSTCSGTNQGSKVGKVIINCYIDLFFPVTNYNTAENEKPDLQKSDFMKPDIVFSEPNDHLLCMCAFLPLLTRIWYLGVE